MKRIVKLIIKKDEVENFITLFKSSRDKILGFDGCNHVELLKARDEECTFFTYSYWDKEEDLNNYRHSEVFKGIWARTKMLFDGKPEAWSVDTVG